MDEPIVDAAGCEKRLNFEMLLADLSARFINLSADRVDLEIENAQRRVCEFLGLDLSALWQWEDNQPDYLVMTHLYRPLGGPPVPDRMEASVHHPWALGEVKAGRTIVMDSTEDVPPEAEKDREVWRHYGIKTNLTFPLKSAAGLPFGAVSFNDMRKERTWTEPMINRLELVADIFSNALIRKQLEMELRHSNAKLALATDSCDLAVWSLNMETRCFWTTDKGREIFGFSADENITVDRFLRRVHPEDIAAVKQTLDQLQKTGNMYQVEYRIIRGDGETRWMASRGRRRCRVPGESSCVVMGVTVDVTDRKESEEMLREALKEVSQLRDQLKKENLYLREQLERDDNQDSIIGESEPVAKMLEQARKVASTDAAVLIYGETGTGKELLAQAIHNMSPRNKRPMVKVNCAALPAPLIEGELFGREKGAYTGAVTRQVGRFEGADGSTIFLDEIAELPTQLQAKLLHVLQDGCFERLGSHKTIHTDVRIVAATNRNLEKMVREGSFREDLYHRLHVFPIKVPPLRERSSDIPILVWKIVQEFNSKMGRSISSIPANVMDRLKSYPWPGNVRELRNVVERAMITSEGTSLNFDLTGLNQAATRDISTLEEMEREHIRDILKRSHWKISGPGGAAEALGLVPTTLHSRMKKLGISRPRF